MIQDLGDAVFLLSACPVVDLLGQLLYLDQVDEKHIRLILGICFEFGETTFQMPGKVHVWNLVQCAGDADLSE